MNGYQGHLVNSGGLQGHSIGNTYPLIVIGRRNGFQLINAATGQEWPVRTDYQQAAQDNS